MCDIPQRCGIYNVYAYTKIKGLYHFTETALYYKITLLNVMSR